MDQKPTEKRPENPQKGVRKSDFTVFTRFGEKNSYPQGKFIWDGLTIVRGYSSLVCKASSTWEGYSGSIAGGMIYTHCQRATSSIRPITYSTRVMHIQQLIHILNCPNPKTPEQRRVNEQTTNTETDLPVTTASDYLARSLILWSVRGAHLL